jgi:hypothetical protein
MREVILRFPANALDEVLDRVLPIVPDGVREARRHAGRSSCAWPGRTQPPAPAWS